MGFPESEPLIQPSSFSKATQSGQAGLLDPARTKSAEKRDEQGLPDSVTAVLGLEGEPVDIAASVRNPHPDRLIGGLVNGQNHLELPCHSGTLGSKILLVGCENLPE